MREQHAPLGRLSQGVIMSSGYQFPIASGRKLRHMLLAATMLAATSPAIAFAQTSPGPDAADSSAVDEVVVTGSRLGSPNLVSNSPVSVTSREEIKAQGVVNAEDLIRDLPSAAPARSGATNNNGNGNTTINLRNLGELRTLVLVDGKRLPPADFSGVMDINSVPTSMIQRVEVLTGGSSAVYGSDAVAGVVNFILRKDFEGIAFDGQYGVTGEGDGATYDANLTFGVNSPDGKGNITAWAGYTKRDAILGSDRDWAKTIYKSDGVGLVPTGSGTIAEGRDLDRGLMFNTSGELVPYDGRLFNNQANRFVIVPQERYLLGALGQYEVSKAFNPYFRASFSQNQVSRQLGEPGFVGAVEVNYGNPFLSDQERGVLFSPGPHADSDLASITLGRRLPEAPFIQENNTYDQFQIVLGTTGEIAEGFTYEVFGQYGHVQWNQQLLGDISFNRFQQGLLVNPDGTCVDPSGGCVPINVFTAAPGAITPEQAVYFSLKQQAVSESSQYVAGASVTGDLTTYGVTSPWAQSGLKLAVGTEYRRESASYQPDDNLAVGNNVVFGSIPPTSGEIDVMEFYGEARAALIEDRPFAKLLEINGGYRRSDYNLAGVANAYKYGLTWAPVEDIRFRASFQRAVRAPTIGELFAPAQPSADVATDPCFANGGAGPTAAQGLCVATGVPVANYGNPVYQCFSTQCTSLVGGNPNLGVETSDTKTFGIVLQPRMIPGFSATIDYFDTKIDGAIAAFGASVQNVFDSCYGTGAGQNPTQDPDNIYCRQIVRDDSGRASGGGRLSQPDGYTSLQNANIGFLRTKGIDAEVTWQRAFADLGIGVPGQFRASLMGTYVTSFDQQLNLSSPVQECVGTVGFICGEPIPRLRVNSRFTWTPNAAFSFSARLRYVSSVVRDIDKFSGAVADPVAHRIGAQAYVDLSGEWTVKENLVLRAGVLNIADKQPPIVPNSVAAANNRGLSNTFLGTYDLGRQFFIGITARY